MRPWTVIYTNDKGFRRADVFSAGFDRSDAVKGFHAQFPDGRLEALIAGDHKDVYIEQPIATNKRIKGVPQDQWFSGF